jgi:hypothetical protein
MKLALALLLLASTAVADPVGGEPMKKVMCRSEGPTAVEVKIVQLGSEPAGHVTKLFEGNGWTIADIDKSGKADKEEHGCLGPSDLRELQAKLDKAKWKITTARNHCMVMATTSTEYTVRGKVVWTERMCSGQTLDKDSAAAIDAVKAAVAKLKP